MNTEPYQITVGALSVEVVRSDIKNLHLGVYPPGGRVRVAVPLAVGDDAVRLAVIGKLGWITRQQARFAAQPRQSRREMVSGESHYVWGRRYRLRVHQHHGPATVALRGRATLDLFVRPGTTREGRELVLQRWYRQQLRAAIPPLLHKWEQALGVHVADWGIKKMKTKWGSCAIAARRVWFNSELAKQPPHCLEYIVAHELTHLLERRHDARFIALLDHHLPTWRTLRAELNRGPLAHHDWSPTPLSEDAMSPGPKPAV